MKHAWLPLIALLLASLLLSSCVSSKGGTLGKTAAAEQAAARQPGNPPAPEQPPVPPSSGVVTTPARGLLVVTNPSDAEVYLNGRYMGRTPLTLEDLTSGAYRLTLRKDGYYEVVAWVNFSGESMRYESNLVQITGFLQVSAVPEDSIITAGGLRLTQGVNELPIGSYDLLIRAFGYGDYRERVSIAERTVTSVDAQLSPVPFSISRAGSSKRSINPMNPGVLGSLEVSFEVTGPGSGEVSVQDAEAREVFHAVLPGFTTWEQHYQWVPRESPGPTLPDGEYRFLITAHGADSDVAEHAEVSFLLDSSRRISLRSVWSGSAGLLFAPTAEVLPAESVQLQFLAAGGATYALALASWYFRAPMQLSARIGVGDSLEIDADAAVIVTDSATPFALGISGRYPLLRAAPSGGFSAAVEAKAAVQVDPAYGIVPTDSFANFTGVTLSLPLQVSSGPVNVLADAGIIASLWQVSYDTVSYSQVPALASWLYLRAGLLLDFGSIVGGISLSARTPPFPWSAFDVAFPIQAGAEIHWLIPGTHLLLSGVFIGEMDNSLNYYFLGGGGLGFLF